MWNIPVSGLSTSICKAKRRPSSLTSNVLIGSLATTEEMAELFFDNFVLAAMLAFEIGLSRAQARIGMIPTSAADAIARVVVEDFDPAAIAREGPDSASIAIPFV